MGLADGNKQSTAHAAIMLVFLAVLGPLSGLALEITLAWRFGASEILDSYRIAVLFLYFGNQLFMGQLLPHVVVPMLSEYSARGESTDGWRLAITLSVIGALASFVLVLWVWLNSGLVVQFLAPGLNEVGKDNAALLVRYFSIALLFTSWSGALGGILYSGRVFWVQPVSQLVFNLVVIACAVVPAGSAGIGALALGVVVSSILSFGIYVANVFRIAHGMKMKFGACLRLGPWTGVRKAFYLLGPLVATVLFSQWYSAVINRALSHSPVGTLTNFGLAWKMLVPLSILTASLATVVFPMLSDARSEGDKAHFQRLVTKGLRMTLFLSGLAGVMVFTVRDSLSSILFQRGAMTVEAVSQVGLLLGVLLIGGPGMALIAFLSKVSYSMQDTRSPMLATLAAAAGMTILLPVVRIWAGAVGVAGAVTLMAWLCGLGLLAYQIWRFRVAVVGELLRYAWVLALLSLLVLITTTAFREVMETLVTSGKLAATVKAVIVPILSLPIAYWLARAMGVGEADEIVRHLWERLKRGYVWATGYLSGENI